MSKEKVLYQKDGSVGKIILNRPDEANALDLETTQQLYEAALSCEVDPEVRAVLLSARGPMFSGGGDLKNFKILQDKGTIGSEVIRITTNYHGAVSTLNRMDAPVVCAIQGTAAGGGLSLALCCDLVIAARSAKFSMAYTAAGLSPDGSSTWFLPRLVGFKRARELFLTNRRFTAEEALEMGLIDQVCDAENLEEESMSLTRKFAEGPTQAFGAVKRLLMSSMTESLETQMDYEARAIARSGQSKDGIEGIAAFTEKRSPSFKGE